MKRLITTVIVTGIVSSAPVYGDTMKRIKSEADYRSQFVGHVFTNAKGDWVTANADGSMTGKFGGKKFLGKWIMSGHSGAAMVFLAVRKSDRTVR